MIFSSQKLSFKPVSDSKNVKRQTNVYLKQTFRNYWFFFSKVRVNTLSTENSSRMLCGNVITPKWTEGSLQFLQKELNPIDLHCKSV